MRCSVRVTFVPLQGYPCFLLFMGMILLKSTFWPNSHCPVRKQRLTFALGETGKSRRACRAPSADFSSINQTLVHPPSTERHTQFSLRIIFLCPRVSSGQNTTTYQILLLFIRRVFSLLNRGNPSSFRISLSEKSMASNWSRVAPRFSMTGIL